MKRSWYLSTARLGGLIVLAVVVVGIALLAPGAAADTTAGTSGNASAQSGLSCRGCHEYATPGIFEQYRHSEHNGADVSCLDCHKAAPGEPSAERHNGAVISPLVTPKDCGTCHPKQVKQFHQSMHDEAIWYAASALAESRGLNTSGTGSLGWNENVLTHNSAASAESGCLECHGTYVQVTNDRHPNAAEDNVKIQNYPNQGIARLNPDGSVGSCAACHPQHRFSLEQARKPQSCSECHLGPDHPQYEIYEETKHSTMFEHNEEEFNLGVDNLTTSDITAPTCAVCHMSGLGDSKSTHDVSARLYWELEPVYSYPTSKRYETGRKRFEIREAFARRYRKKYDLPRGSLDSVPTGAPNPFAAAKANVPELYDRYVGEGKWWDDVGDNGGATRWDSFGGKSAVSAKKKRQNMIDVCTECHTETWVRSEFEKRDAIPHLYDAVISAAKQKYYDPIKKQAPEAEPYNRSYVDAIFFEMWHHEGRRWRMGALMQGQDYEHWHGSHDVLQDVLKLAHIKKMLERTGDTTAAVAADGPTEVASRSGNATAADGGVDATAPDSGTSPVRAPGLSVAIAGLAVIAGALVLRYRH